MIINNYRLKQFCDVMKHFDPSSAPLMEQIEKCAISAIQNLPGFTALIKPPKGCHSPLHFPIHNEFVQFLLARGADPNATDPQGNTPLHRAILSRLDKEPFYHAKIEETIEMLLKHGASINALNHQGRSPLYYAGNDQELYNFLISRGACLADETGAPLLTFGELKKLIPLYPAFESVCCGKKGEQSISALDLKEIKRLPGFAQFIETIALQYFLKEGNVRAAIVLLSLGADPQHALANWFTFEKKGFVWECCLQLLLLHSEKTKADLLLLEAAEAGNLERAETLLLCGVSPDDDLYAFPPMEMAIWRKNTPLISLLAAHGGGKKLMRKAIANGDLARIDLLAKARFNLNVQLTDNIEYTTPLIYAEIFKQPQVAKRLIELGADPLLTQEIIDRKFLAHVFSVSGRSLIEWRGIFKGITLQGFEPHLVQRRLADQVRRFFSSKDSIPSEIKDQIIEALDKPLSNIENSAQAVLKRIKENKPVIILGGYTNHAVVFLHCHDKLIICNRGDGAEHEGLMVVAGSYYDCPASSVTEKMLDQWKNSDQHLSEFKYMIHKLEKTSEKHLQNPQKEGTCAWTSCKTAFFALLKEYFAAETAYALYKEFTEFSRVDALLQYEWEHLSAERAPYRDHYLIERLKSRKRNQVSKIFKAKL